MLIHVRAYQGKHNGHLASTQHDHEEARTVRFTDSNQGYRIDCVQAIAIHSDKPVEVRLGYYHTNDWGEVQEDYHELVTSTLILDSAWLYVDIRDIGNDATVQLAFNTGACPIRPGEPEEVQQ